MISIVLLAVLLLLSSFSVYAANGTIKKIDTEIIVEYSGDDAETAAYKQKSKAEMEEQKHIEEQKEKTAEIKISNVKQTAKEIENNLSSIHPLVMIPMRPLYIHDLNRYCRGVTQHSCRC